jgi:DNA (cytosine-5)-methyltransferase 1
VDTTKELPTVIAFCAGYGGIERGLDLAGVEHRVVAYVEIEAFAIANLVAKMETGQLDPAPIYTDLKTFPAEVFRDRVDIITGGYPCQPFSAAGKRKGTDDPRHLWPYIRRHIESIRPVQCFFENVEGHISLGLSTVVSDLEEDGYTTTWGIFSAREVGAPHQRKRVYIMGNSKHYGSLATKKRRGTCSTSNNDKEGKKEAIQSKGAGQSSCSTDIRGGQYVPNSNSGIGRQGGYQQPEQQQSGSLCQDVPNPSGIGLQGGAKFSPCPGESETAHQGCETARTHIQRGQHRSTWEPEPRLGRVVDGCANRVDRLRLLGNAVVPQTAAKAYETLMRRYQ